MIDPRRVRVSEGRPVVSLGRAICSDLGVAEEREWLVTNGLGSFASGTVAGIQTRRYHGLLIAALNPPVGRTYLVAKLEESVRYDGRAYALATNRWRGGAVEPQGFRYIERFRLEGTVPVWTFSFADAEFEKRIWMEQEAQTTYSSYRLLRASKPVVVTVRALVNYRDFHASTHAGDWRMNVEATDRGAGIGAFDGAVPIYVRADRGSVQLEHEWYRNFDLARERARGLDDSEDHLLVTTFTAHLAPGDTLTVVASLDGAASLDGEAALERQRVHEQSVLECFGEPDDDDPDWVRQLALAADQFVVRCPGAKDRPARSIVAGYHWFGDWGRDTMIALPGLTIATGRAPIAGTILETFAQFIDGGMLPNYFPDADRPAEYNTVDAALWFVEAVRAYVDDTGDDALLARLIGPLTEIVSHYRSGTRYGIRQDPGDGLIYAGAPGVQLTWMDAKVGDYVVTPRIGKPIEVNALWYNALRAMDSFSRRLGTPSLEYAQMAEATRDGFRRFWNPEQNYCYDVLDGPGGHDASLRPNQIFAVSLPNSALEATQQRGVVDVCGRRLLTPAGLRSLADDEADYHPSYGGTPLERDGAYHQGTVWGWLMGPWVNAYLRVYDDVPGARARLQAMVGQLDSYGLGSLPEIAAGDAPNRPDGCIAQAWTVAEVLRAWRSLRKGGSGKHSPAC